MGETSLFALCESDSEGLDARPQEEEKRNLLACESASIIKTSDLKEVSPFWEKILDIIGKKRSHPHIADGSGIKIYSSSSEYSSVSDSSLSKSSLSSGRFIPSGLTAGNCIGSGSHADLPFSEKFLAKTFANFLTSSPFL